MVQINIYMLCVKNSTLYAGKEKDKLGGVWRESSLQKGEQLPYSTN